MHYTSAIPLHMYIVHFRKILPLKFPLLAFRNALSDSIALENNNSISFQQALWPSFILYSHCPFNQSRERCSGPASR